MRTQKEARTGRRARCSSSSSSSLACEISQSRESRFGPLRRAGPKSRGSRVCWPDFFLPRLAGSTCLGPGYIYSSVVNTRISLRFVNAIRFFFFIFLYIVCFGPGLVLSTFFYSLARDGFVSEASGRGGQLVSIETSAFKSRKTLLKRKLFDFGQLTKTMGCWLPSHLRKIFYVFLFPFSFFVNYKKSLERVFFFF